MSEVRALHGERAEALRALVRQLTSFVGVGLLTNLVYFGALALFASAKVMALWLSAALAYAISMLVNYLLQRRLTFQSRRAHREAVVRYLTAQCLALSLNSALLGLLVTRWDLPFLLGQGAALVLTTTLSYFLQRSWVFAAR